MITKLKERIETLEKEILILLKIINELKESEFYLPLEKEDYCD